MDYMSGAIKRPACASQTYRFMHDQTGQCLPLLWPPLFPRFAAAAISNVLRMSASWSRN